MLTLPLQHELQQAKTVLLAGCGGGFDVFSGLPLYFALEAAGKAVHLANLTFSNIPPDAGRRLGSEVVEVAHDANGMSSYFPEKHLSKWFHLRGRQVNVWAIERFGPAAVARAYRALTEELRPDTVVLVDGGTDSLMRGDEAGLGTPVEDISSLVAVDALEGVDRKLHVCLGFGVDHFHGVSHVDVLEAVAELSRAGGFLGALSLTRDMPEVRQFAEAVAYVQQRTPGRESIVCSSIVSAIDGEFGDHHPTPRTAGSEMFINPLMAVYWGFRVDALVRRIHYIDRIRHLDGFRDAERAIAQFRAHLSTVRPRRRMPL
jgi:hypothetical protein